MIVLNVLLAWLLTSFVFGVLWSAAVAVTTVRRRWRRRRRVTRLSSFVLEDVRSRVGVREVGGSRSWAGRR